MNYADLALELARLNDIRATLTAYEEALRQGQADSARACINRVEGLASSAWFALMKSGDTQP